MQIIGWIIFGILVLYFVIAFIIFLTSSNKKVSKLLKVNDEKFIGDLSPFHERMSAGKRWVDKQEKEDLYIHSKDNLKLHGMFIPNKNNKKIMILSHGYGSTPERDIYSSCSEYYNMGFSLLIIDLRACGESEGKWFTFGYHEHEDLALWVKYIHKNYKNSEIIIGGVSLGATIALMTPNINKHVDGIIADSGYVNAYEQVGYIISYFFHMPKLFMPMVNVYYKWFLHVNLRWVDTVNSLKNIKIPILFIHGIDDEFVLIDNTITNYNSYKGKKEKLFVNYATHGASYLYDRNAYVETIKKFLKKHGL